MEQLVIISVIVFLGGLIKGFAGFGYAVASIGLLSFYFPADTAVIIMIAPLLVGNLVLINEVEKKQLEHCLRNFWGFMVSVLFGVIAGMYLIGSLPISLLSDFIGLFILLYAASSTDFLGLHSERLKKICFKKNQVFQALAGFIGGTVFGSMSIGALIVSYLDSIDLDRPVFIGLLSFVLFVVSAIRIVFSWLFGYYSGSELLLVSAVAGVPGLLGIEIGSRCRTSSELYEKAVIAVFLIIGIRLILAS